MSTIRKHPRVRSNHPGQLEIVLPGDNGLPESTRISVTIRSVSCEGVGLAFDGRPDRTLGRGDTITMHIPGDHDAMEIPGRIVWFNDKHRYPLQLGVHLHLGLARPTARHAYANWVVDQSKVQLGG